MDKNNKKILAIDDDPGTIRLLEKRLGANGYEVTGAEDGKTGIEKAKNEKPDLIVLDIKMPDLSGAEVAEKLATTPETRDIPIVILSVTLNKRGKQKVEINGRAYPAVAKPFYQPDLLSAIKKALKN